MVEVIFYKGNDPLSRFIKWWTGGRFSHCGFRLWGCLVLDIDALHGVRVRFNPWRPRDYKAIRIDRDPVEILDAVYRSRWVEYSLLEGIRCRLPWIPDDPHKWNCAEMVNDIHVGETQVVRDPDYLYEILHTQEVQ